MPSHAGVRSNTCEHVPAQILSDDPDAAELACDGAQDAASFLRKFGLHTDEVIRIELVRELPSSMRAEIVGCYNIGERRVILLDPEKLHARGMLFGIPVDRSLYRSAVAHEVAHAVVACHPSSRTLPLAAHEYVAYVTMFATMGVETLERILETMPGTGFAHSHQINNLTYALDPERFGIAAYRHWRVQPDRAEFLDRLLAGEVVTEVDY